MQARSHAMPVEGLQHIGFEIAGSIRRPAERETAYLALVPDLIALSIQLDLQQLNPPR